MKMSPLVFAVAFSCSELVAANGLRGPSKLSWLNNPSFDVQLEGILNSGNNGVPNNGIRSSMQGLPSSMRGSPMQQSMALNQQSPASLLQRDAYQQTVYVPNPQQAVSVAAAENGVVNREIEPVLGGISAIQRQSHINDPRVEQEIGLSRQQQNQIGNEFFEQSQQQKLQSEIQKQKQQIQTQQQQLQAQRQQMQQEIQMRKLQEKQRQLNYQALQMRQQQQMSQRIMENGGLSQLQNAGLSQLQNFGPQALNPRLNQQMPQLQEFQPQQQLQQINANGEPFSMSNQGISMPNQGMGAQSLDGLQPGNAQSLAGLQKSQNAEKQALNSISKFLMSDSYSSGVNSQIGLQGLHNSLQGLQNLGMPNPGMLNPAIANLATSNIQQAVSTQDFLADSLKTLDSVTRKMKDMKSKKHARHRLQKERERAREAAERAENREWRREEEQERMSRREEELDGRKHWGESREDTESEREDEVWELDQYRKYRNDIDGDTGEGENSWEPRDDWRSGPDGLVGLNEEDQLLEDRDVDSGRGTYGERASYEARRGFGERHRYDDEDRLEYDEQSWRDEEQFGDDNRDDFHRAHYYGNSYDRPSYFGGPVSNIQPSYAQTNPSGGMDGMPSRGHTPSANKAEVQTPKVGSTANQETSTRTVETSQMNNGDTVTSSLQTGNGNTPRVRIEWPTGASSEPATVNGKTNEATDLIQMPSSDSEDEDLRELQKTREEIQKYERLLRKESEGDPAKSTAHRDSAAQTSQSFIQKAEFVQTDGKNVLSKDDITVEPMIDQKHTLKAVTFIGLDVPKEGELVADNSSDTDRSITPGQLFEFGVAVHQKEHLQSEKEQSDHGLAVNLSQRVHDQDGTASSFIETGSKKIIAGSKKTLPTSIQNSFNLDTQFLTTAQGISTLMQQQEKQRVEEEHEHLKKVDEWVGQVAEKQIAEQKERQREEAEITASAQTDKKSKTGWWWDIPAGHSYGADWVASANKRRPYNYQTEYDSNGNRIPAYTGTDEGGYNHQYFTNVFDIEWDSNFARNLMWDWSDCHGCPLGHPITNLMKWIWDFGSWPFYYMWYGLFGNTRPNPGDPDYVQKKVKRVHEPTCKTDDPTTLAPPSKSGSSSDVFMSSGNFPCDDPYADYRWFPRGKGFFNFVLHEVHLDGVSKIWTMWLNAFRDAITFRMVPYAHNKHGGPQPFFWWDQVYDDNTDKTHPHTGSDLPCYARLMEQYSCPARSDDLGYTKTVGECAYKASLYARRAAKMRRTGFPDNSLQPLGYNSTNSDDVTVDADDDSDSLKKWNPFNMFLPHAGDDQFSDANRSNSNGNSGSGGTPKFVDSFLYDTFEFGRPEIPGSAGKCLIKFAGNGCWGQLEENMRFDTFMLTPCRKELSFQRVCLTKQFKGSYCKSANSYLGKAVTPSHCALAIRKENAFFTFGNFGPDMGACYVEHTLSNSCENSFEVDMHYDTYRITDCDKAPTVFTYTWYLLLWVFWFLLTGLPLWLFLCCAHQCFYTARNLVSKGELTGQELYEAYRRKQMLEKKNNAGSTRTYKTYREWREQNMAQDIGTLESGAAKRLHQDVQNLKSKVAEKNQQIEAKLAGGVPAVVVGSASSSSGVERASSSSDGKPLSAKTSKEMKA